MGSSLNIEKCNTSFGKLAYYRIGAGEKVLLVHGITTYSFIWRKLVPLLKNNYELIIPDLLGCGESDKPLNTEYSLKQHAEILNEFVNILKLDKFHFVGHDVGGGIGQIYACNYETDLLDLTLINSVAFDFWPVQPIVSMRIPIIRQLAMASLDLGTFKLVVKRGLFYKERADKELMDYFWKPMKTSEGRKAFLHFARCLNNQNLLEISDQLENLKIPVLILRGDQDVYLSKTISVNLNNHIPESKLVILNNGGHFIQEDVPEEIEFQLKKFFTLTAEIENG